jgi:hypothetical protein
MKINSHPSFGLIRAALLLVAPILFQGCATAPISAQSLAEVRRAPVIHVVRYAEGIMMVTTPGSVTGAGAGAILTGSDSVPADASVLERKFGLPDATQEVTERLLDKLRVLGGYSNFVVEPNIVPFGVHIPDDLSEYGRKYPNSYVLEIAMSHRSLGYNPIAWRTYYFSQWTQARLIRTSDSKLLWSGRGGGLGPKLSVADIQMNSDGAKFTELFHATLEECSRQLADQFVAKN